MNLNASWLGKWLGTGIMLLSAGAGGILIMLAFSTGLIGLFFLGLALVCALTAGILFIRIWLPLLTGWLVDGILFPKHHLQQAPVMLSPIAGMITEGRYREAEERLLAFHSAQPGNPEITGMLLELYVEKLHQPTEACSVAVQYLEQRSGKTGPLYLQILFQYLDLLQSVGRTQEIPAILQYQLRYGHLTGTEQKAVQVRLKPYNPEGEHHV